MRYETRSGGHVTVEEFLKQYLSGCVWRVKGLVWGLLFWVQILFFDLRLIFLLTAQRVEVRNQLAQELHGISLLGNQCSE